MRKELQEIEKIERYLMGKLTVEEQKKFEEQINKDSLLEEQVMLQKSLLLGIERLGLKTELVQIRRRLQIKRIAIRGLIIAALVTGAYVGLNYMNTESVHKEVFLKEPKVIVDSIKEASQKEKLSVVKEIDSIVKKTEGKTKNILEDGSLLPEFTMAFDFAELPEKEVQTFRIDPTKENTITGKEGTQIIIPANGFQTSSDVTVEINLKEFYKISDIVFANLTTQTTEGELLETGGMIHLQASQGTQKKLKLKEGQSIEVKFPIGNKRLDGMKLFEGSSNTGGDIVWESVEEKVNTVGGKMIYTNWHHNRSIDVLPSFVYLDLNSTKYLNNIFRFPKIDASRVKGRLRLSIEVDQRGQILSVKPIRGVKFPIKLYPYAIRAAKLLPAVIPYKREDNYLITSYDLELSLEQGNDKRMLSKEMVELYYDSLEKARKNERVPTLQDLNYRHKVLNAAKKDSIGRRIFSEDNLKQEDLQHYVVLSTNLGWLNCDRDLKDNRPKLTLKVKEAGQNLQISAIYHTYKAVIKPSRYKDGEYRFNHVPKGEKFSVLAIKTIGVEKEIYYGELINDGSLHRLDFSALTKENLDRIMLELNSIYN